MLNCVVLLGLLTIALWTMPAGAAPFAYVADELLDTIWVNDTATNTVAATVPIPGGNVPYGLSVTPDGAFVYVALADVATVLVIDTAKALSDPMHAVVASIPVGDGPYRIAITPDGAFAYVANIGSGTVSVLATATNTVVATIPVGSRLCGLAITPNGALAYIEDNASNIVSVLDTSKALTDPAHAVVAIIPVEHACGLAITPNGAFVYLPVNLGDGSAIISVVATATNTVVATVPLAAPDPVGVTFGEVAITPNGAFVYVPVYSNEKGGLVSGGGKR
jgi:YVTN family beta-propeller protein